MRLHIRSSEALLLQRSSMPYSQPHIHNQLYSNAVVKSLKNHFLRDISGSIVVLIFAGICMFAMLQLK